jgi:hypothetical protein
VCVIDFSSSHFYPFIFVATLVVFHLFFLSFPLLLQLFCFCFSFFKHFLFFITMLRSLPLLIVESLVMHITLVCLYIFLVLFFLFGFESKSKKEK